MIQRWSNTMIYEIRDYTIEKEWFEQYVAWVKDFFLPYAKHKINIIDFWAYDGVEAEVEGKNPVVSPNGHTIIEPIVNFTLAPSDKEYLKIPNEDSIAFELNSVNILDTDRIQGFDRWEYGNRINYGLQISHFWGERVI